MSQRPRNKRQQTSAQQSSYHDAVPIAGAGDYGVIHSSEATLRNIGGLSRTSRLYQAPQHTGDNWQYMSSWSPPDDDSFALEADGTGYDAAVEADVMNDAIITEAAGKKKRSRVSKRPHIVWMESHRQTYLDEIMRWSGHGDFQRGNECPDCLARGHVPAEKPLYRCRECILPDLTCQACCIKRHRLQSFHQIEQWTGSHFIDTSLASMGLFLQLNHSASYCENPIPCHVDMLILHTNGIHALPIRYCGCSRQLPHHLQLLRRRLYPASQLAPKTCALFELLRHLHKLSLTTKGSNYDFYRCLEKSTNNTGIGIPKSQYRAMMRMSLQWRHLQMLKWAGRGQENDGVAATTMGQLAIICPSCPQPGINIPGNWEDAPDNLKFLYTVIICMDANFRLRNQIVSNYSQDPGMGIGWAYMVPRHPYKSYVLSRANDKDISTCVGFQALAKSNTKFSKGLRYTGCNLTVCGRSEMILPVGVGNLHKGERYANMDYIFGSTLRFVRVAMVLISYDIACQWFVNLFKRISEDWPPEIKPSPRTLLAPAIPKLHKPAHKTANHEEYSLNYIPGVGHSDCECPEHVWGPHNPLANSTKTQGPGSRQDILDDHFGFWNWLKYASLGATLLRRYIAAVAQRNIQTEGHRGLTKSVNNDELVDEWEKMCVEWENDKFPKKKKNPYYMPDDTLSEAQVKKDLADEEAEHIAKGGSFPHATTAAMFISMGHELEEAQRRLRRTVKEHGKEMTVRQDGALSEQRNGLLVRIHAWEQLSPIYMPGLLQYHADYPPDLLATENAEDAQIWLPSRIPEPHRSRICAQGLPKIKERMRLAQLTDSLNAVRHILKIKTRMIHFKNKNIRGQCDGTRSTTVIDRVHERARFSAAKYRAARVAYYGLVGAGDWEDTFRKLEDGDIRGYQDPNKLKPYVGRAGTLEDDQVEAARQQGSQVEREEEDPNEDVLYNDIRVKRNGSGETRRTLSWIWTSMRVGGTEDEKDDILRVEWAKSRARANRGREEVMLLKEEMHRVLEFLDWKANWWKQRVASRDGTSLALQEGVSAFVHSQAKLQTQLRTHFYGLWRAPLAGETQETPVRANDNEDEGDSEVEVDEDEGEANGDLLLNS